MAENDTMFTLYAQDGLPPVTSPATPDVIVVTSDATVDGIVPVLLFDGAALEHMDWMRQVPSNYSGRGFDVQIKYAIAATGTNQLRWEVRMLKITDTEVITSENIDGQTEVAILDSPPSTPQDKLNYTTATLLTHAFASSPAVGDFLRIRVTRDPVSGDDTNTDDAQLVGVLVTES